MLPSKLLSQEWAKMQEQRVADYLLSFDDDTEDDEDSAVLVNDFEQWRERKFGQLGRYMFDI